MNERLSSALKKRALALGFTTVGISDARPARRLEAYHRWLLKSYHGDMDYMARSDRTARRENLNLILPGVQAIVTVGLDYRSATIPDEIANDPGRGRISNYAWGIDYHDIMEKRLDELGEWLHAQTGGESASRVYVDTGAILERDHAESAGLGFTGKNTMLIGPRTGSYFFLGQLLTTMPFIADPENARLPSCGSCSRCMDACPTGAFPAPFVLDARRCISYLTIELKGWIPVELRSLMGNWIYGCDVCQAVCPFNRFSPDTREEGFRPRGWDSAAPPLVEILALDEAGFQARFAGSPIKRIGRVRLLRNACVAAGNWGSREAIPALTGLLEDPEPLLRGHAAWALGRIGDDEVVKPLTIALMVEDDDDVRKEMVNSL